MDTKSGVRFSEAGVTTSAERAEREAFEAAYGDEHIGKDTYAPNF